MSHVQNNPVNVQTAPTEMYGNYTNNYAKYGNESNPQHPLAVNQNMNYPEPPQ